MSLRFARLTRPAIRALANGGRIAEHGIIAERLSNGDVRYSVDVLCDGQRIHRVVGRESEGVTRAQAETYIEQARTDARSGRLNLPKGRKVQLLFAEAADDYITRLKDSAGKNVTRKERQLALHLKPHFGKTRLDKITDFAVKGYRKARRDAKAADATINRELATLSHLTRSAARWGWIKRDDVPTIDRAREGQGRIIALNQAQCDALMAASIADQDGDLWIFVAIGLGTGMRHDEITSIKWPQIDFARRRIFVPLAKAGSREQPIPADLAAKLEAERKQAAKPDGWLFPAKVKDTKEGRRKCFAASFRRAATAAGLDAKAVTPHVMRHTAVTRLVRAGADIPTIMKVSGHKTVAMVLRYTHVDAADIDAATAALDMGNSGATHREVTAPENSSAAKAA
ncbi:tyrosine-type recombinase/integrase [Glacieibacterium sp.]|uniref:tyrosine-type recombinase/integrase n=1 Tax=Glacieibacterium sp. TaxID=2860237 RepID=UPI003AFFB8EA